MFKRFVLILIVITSLSMTACTSNNNAKLTKDSKKYISKIESNVKNVYIPTYKELRIEEFINSDIDDQHNKLSLNSKTTYSPRYVDVKDLQGFNNYVENHVNDKSRISFDENGQPNGVIVRRGEIFVLGDNWNVSKDSSLIGPISKKCVIGRVDIVVKPSQNEFLAILKGIF